MLNLVNLVKGHWRFGILALFCLLFGEEICGHRKKMIRPQIMMTQVIDGDTLIVNGVKIGLKGIDAPELKQKCTSDNICGQKAAYKLEELIGEHDVFCSHEGLDRYGRQLGYCYAGGVNLNAEMVRSGYAKAYLKYEKTFASEELEAKRKHIGMWGKDEQVQ